MIPQSDIDELAQWFFECNGSFSAHRWKSTSEQSKNRWRSMAKKMLSEIPEVILRHAKELA